MASRDISISSALLIASMLYQRRQANVRKRERAREWIRAQQQNEKWTKNRDDFYPKKLVARLIKRGTTCQTGNFVAQQTCATKLLDFVACLTWALSTSTN